MKFWFFFIAGSEGDWFTAVGLHENSGVGHPVWSARGSTERPGEVGSLPGSCAEQVLDENRWAMGDGSCGTFSCCLQKSFYYTINLILIVLQEISTNTCTNGIGEYI